jgi:hypothetical protein
MAPTPGFPNLPESEPSAIRANASTGKPARPQEKQIPAKQPIEKEPQECCKQDK